jgi:hypothetical protein
MPGLEVSLSCFGDLLYFYHIFIIFSQKYFGFLKNGQKKCPKLKRFERLSKKTTFVTEMKN